MVLNAGTEMMGSRSGASHSHSLYVRTLTSAIKQLHIYKYIVEISRFTLCRGEQPCSKQQSMRPFGLGPILYICIDLHTKGIRLYNYDAIS